MPQWLLFWFPLNLKTVPQQQTAQNPCKSQPTQREKPKVLFRTLAINVQGNPRQVQVLNNIIRCRPVRFEHLKSLHLLLVSKATNQSTGRVLPRAPAAHRTHSSGTEVSQTPQLTPTHRCPINLTAPKTCATAVQSGKDKGSGLLQQKWGE